MVAIQGAFVCGVAVALALVFVPAGLARAQPAPGADPEVAAGPLRIYGPGGPYPAIVECAALFTAQTGQAAIVVKDQPELLIERLARDGDLFYDGAEYMMDDFLARHPGLLDPETVRPLSGRRIGIIVRPGNPLGLRSVADLRRPGLALLDVELENMAGPRQDPEAGSPNVALRVRTGEQGFAAWRDHPELDAWTTYRTWHAQLQDGSEFLPIPGPRGVRRIEAALVAGRRGRGAAAFLSFLQSETARAVFRRHGYEPSNNAPEEP